MIVTSEGDIIMHNEIPNCGYTTIQSLLLALGQLNVSWLKGCPHFGRSIYPHLYLVGTMDSVLIREGCPHYRSILDRRMPLYLIIIPAGYSYNRYWVQAMKLILLSTEIRLSVQPNDLSLPEGQLAAFECNTAYAKPRAAVTWYKDSAPIDDAADPRVYVSRLTGTLMIREVLMSDRGLYHCDVLNVAGRLTSRGASLTVLASNVSGMIILCW